MIANQEYLDNEIEQLRIGFQDKVIQKVHLLRPHQIRRNVDSGEAERNFAVKKNKRVFWTFQQKVSKIPLQYQFSFNFEFLFTTSSL